MYKEEMYKAKNIDTDKALQALKEARDFQSGECERIVNETKAYYRGLAKGLDIAESIFYCSNYEKDGKDE